MQVRDRVSAYCVVVAAQGAYLRVTDMLRCFYSGASVQRINARLCKQNRRTRGREHFLLSLTLKRK